MTVENLIKTLSLCPVALENPTAEIDGVYVGDLLSRAMSHLQKNNVWVTIMTNKNVIAVAGLSEISAVILAEGTTLLPDALEAAKENHVNVFASDLPAYELCGALSVALAEKP